MSDTSTKNGSDSITPAVHLEFIQNQLESPGQATAEEVEKYHRAVFLHHHAVEWETERQRARTHQDAVTFLEVQLRDTEVRLAQRTKLLPVVLEGREDVQPSVPWNAWDVAMFALCCLAIAGLIAFGVMNISFNLLESGFVTFRENPFRCYLWTALLPVGALAVKVGWDFLKDPKKRDIYLWSCLGVGVGAVLVWLAAYAFVYPTLSKSINEQIAGLTVFDNSASGSGSAALNFAGAKWLDVVTVGAQALAEIFLSAVLGMHLTNLYARHRPVRLGHDPVYLELEKERRRLAEELSRERANLGQANGNLVRLENQLSALIAFGKSMFNREAARRQDQTQRRQVILDQLSDHLREHLDGANGRSPAVTGS